MVVQGDAHTLPQPKPLLLPSPKNGQRSKTNKWVLKLISFAKEKVLSLWGKSRARSPSPLGVAQQIDTQAISLYPSLIPLNLLSNKITVSRLENDADANRIEAAPFWCNANDNSRYLYIFSCVAFHVCLPFFSVSDSPSSHLNNVWR